MGVDGNKTFTEESKNQAAPERAVKVRNSSDAFGSAAIGIAMIVSAIVSSSMYGVGGKIVEAIDNNTKAIKEQTKAIKEKSVPSCPRL